jgi:hypothetical protein
VTPSWGMDEIRSGLGWPRGRHQLVLTGTLGEGPGRNLRGSCCSRVCFEE